MLKLNHNNQNRQIPGGGESKNYSYVDLLDFSSNYRSRNPVIKFLLERFYDKLESLVTPFIGDVEALLEVGSGEGYSTSWLREIFRQHDTKFFSSDLVFGLVLRNRKRTGEENLFVQDIMSLAVGTNKVDLVIALEVLEHLPDPTVAVIELARVTRKWAMVSVPFEPWWRIGNMLRGAYLAELGNTPDHRNQWGKHSFANLLKKEFSKVEVKVSFPWLIASCKK